MILRIEFSSSNDNLTPEQLTTMVRKLKRAVQKAYEETK